MTLGTAKMRMSTPSVNITRYLDLMTMNTMGNLTCTSRAGNRNATNVTGLTGKQEDTRLMNTTMQLSLTYYFD